MMIKAFRRMLCFCLFACLLAHSGMIARAQINPDAFIRIVTGESAKARWGTQMPRINPGDFTAPILPTFRYDFLPPPFAFVADTSASLRGAISRRLGIRYRFYGSDDRGYDCSGFVWRVFSEAGADFERVAARTLWRELPAAEGEETRQFGTLVFFNGLKHIGIVRDADSFYHASRSQGITLSRFTGYWEKRITGFRRAPLPIIPPPPESIKMIDRASGDSRIDFFK
jgi:hypothetical protein